MLPPSNLKQRITGVFGKAIDQELIPLKIDTSVVQIEGYIGKPEFARKSNSHNFFFVNNRFFKHQYYFRTMMQAYGNLINAESKPVFFVYFTIPPASIDVNIHPTKTEIKFENEQIIFRYLNSAVKESLGKSNMIPSIDFDSNPFIDLPPVPKNYQGNTPEIKINPDYNPFKTTTTEKRPVSFESRLSDLKNQIHQPEIPNRREEQAFLEIGTAEKHDFPNTFLQIKGKYILTTFKSGLIYIDQRRAHKRILFEEFLVQHKNRSVVTEKIAFPETVTVSTEEFPLLTDLLPVLTQFGFDIGEFGKNAIIIHGIPAGLNSFSGKEFVQEFLHSFRENHASLTDLSNEMMAGFLADASCIKYGKVLAREEMQYIFDKLFACSQPSYTHSGKQVFVIVPTEEIDKQFR
jgi:DNA mismatch repair protein MutL